MPTVTDWLAEEYPEALLADGFNAAILGVGERCGQPPIVVYDAERCLDVLMGWDMDYEEAAEYLSFNVTGAWVGPSTPLFLWRAPGQGGCQCLPIGLPNTRKQGMPDETPGDDPENGRSSRSTPEDVRPAV